MSRATIWRVDEITTQIVALKGALSGRYEVLEKGEDGTVLLGPDTSAEATMRRSGSRSQRP